MFYLVMLLHINKKVRIAKIITAHYYLIQKSPPQVSAASV